MPDPLTVAVARAVAFLLRRELAEDESIRMSYGDATGTPPRDVVECLEALESSARGEGVVL